MKQTDYKDWSNSPEGIHYDFAGCHGISIQGEGFFFTVLSKLPEEVRAFAKDNIFFVELERETLGICHNFKKGKIAKEYNSLVIFSASLWSEPITKIKDTVAHEIAHAYLGHDILWNHSIEKEIQADDLAGKWLGRKITHYREMKNKLKNNP